MDFIKALCGIFLQLWVISLPATPATAWSALPVAFVGVLKGNLSRVDLICTLDDSFHERAWRTRGIAMVLIGIGRAVRSARGVRREDAAHLVGEVVARSSVSPGRRALRNGHWRPGTRRERREKQNGALAHARAA